MSESQRQTCGVSHGHFGSKNRVGPEKSDAMSAQSLQDPNRPGKDSSVSKLMNTITM